MKSPLFFGSGRTSNNSSKVALYTILPLWNCRLMEAWRLDVLLVPSQGRILLFSQSPNRMSNFPNCSMSYLPAPVIRWKNTLFLGVDACFKLKLKDRGFKDTSLCTGLAYMVNEDPYQQHLDRNANVIDPVSFHQLLY